MRLFMANERRLCAYIFSLVPNWTDAQDILQETNTRLWEQFDKFEQGTNFLAWACSIAHYRVLAYRKQQQRSRLNFSDHINDLLENQLAARHESAGAERDCEAERHEALAHCVGELSDRDRELVRRFYVDRAPIKKISTESSRSVQALYMALSRIRRALFACIQKVLGTGEPGP